jgi:hypothetical protein
VRDFKAPGASRRQMKDLRNLQELGIPHRFDVVLCPGVVPQTATSPSRSHVEVDVHATAAVAPDGSPL